MYHMYGKQTLSVFRPPSLTSKGGSFEPLDPPPPPTRLPEYSRDLLQAQHFFNAKITLSLLTLLDVK